MTNVIALHRDLSDKSYRHSAYKAFKINDPKPRDIHKACVRDRLLHHAIHRMLYPFFGRVFVADSYSCQTGKGTHKAIDRFRSFSYKVTENHTKTAWVLKCDIKKFFATIDQVTLLAILATYIPDKNILVLLAEIVGSFSSTEKGKGLPLGNLTSQLLVNVYMNEFDQFMKHKIKVKYYIRYADDFVVMAQDEAWLESILPRIKDFLWTRLKLRLHQNKISIRTIASGVDYLGWVHFKDHRALRTVAKRRMFRRLKDCGYNSASVQSYLGLLKHGNTSKLRDMLEFEFTFLFLAYLGERGYLDDRNENSNSRH